MPTVNYQSLLKEKYGINKNVSNVLSRAELEALWQKLEHESEFHKLIQSLIRKNQELANNNKQLGGARWRAERSLSQLQGNYKTLKVSYRDLEQQLTAMDAQTPSSAPPQELGPLLKTNQALTQKLEKLESTNQDLKAVNDELKKDNKDLKTIVDKVRLDLARRTRELLTYEDHELRKAMVRMFKGILG